MQPNIQPLPDDSAIALRVIEDLQLFCRKLRFGIQALDNPLRIAIVEPEGPAMPVGWKHTRQTAPITRELVTQWKEITNGQYLHGQSYMKQRATSGTVRMSEILDAVAQVLRHYNACLIPMPVEGEPTIILCEDSAVGQRRAYGVIAQLDCYGYKDRPVRPRAQ